MYFILKFTVYEKKIKLRKVKNMVGSFNGISIMKTSLELVDQGSIV